MPRKGTTKNYVYRNDDGESVSDLTANSETCVICDDKIKQYEFWNLCDECHNWYHPQCLGLDPQTEAKKTPWICPSCNEKEKGEEQSVATLRDISNQDVNFNQGDCESIQGIDCVEDTSAENQTDENTQTNNTDSEPFAESTTDTDDEGNQHVKSIVGWRQTTKGREFQVQYKKDKPNEWLLEKDLKGCPLLVEYFCLKQKIDKPNYLKRNMIRRKKVGNINKAEANEHNWVNVDRIIDMVKSYGFTKDSLIPKPFTKLGNAAGIYFVVLGDHCLTLLHNPNERSCLIADGANAFLNDSNIKKILLLQLKGLSTLQVLRFNGQKGVDHCATSAAGIAIEFQRIYRTGIVPKEITVPKSTMERIATILHKEPSKSAREWIPINEIAWKVKCSQCDKKFKTNNRGVLNLHKCPGGNN